MRSLIAALFFLSIYAEAETPQQIRWNLGAYTQTSIQPNPYGTIGFGIGLELPVTETYWVDAFGKSMSVAGGSEAQVFLGLARHWMLNQNFELEIALGPEYVHSDHAIYYGDYVGANIQARVSYWIDEHWAVGVEPSYQAVVRSGVESLAGLSLMLTYGR